MYKRQGETVTVTITPLNGNLEPVAPCASESFTIVSETPVVPNCTNLTSPIDGAIDIAVDTDITWNPVANATGYRITINSTSRNNDIIRFDNGNSTTYNTPVDFDNDEVVNVIITPYNGTLEPVTPCASESFTIVSETLALPNCTNLNSPIDGDIDVAISTNILWNAVDNASGYRLTIGTSPGGNNILNNQDLGNTTSYNPPENLPERTRIYVTITPYNAVGDALACSEESFLTETLPDQVRYGFSPNGDGINDFWEITGIEDSPNNQVSIYNRWGDLVFQMSQYDNQSRVFRGLANRKEGIGAGELPEGTYFFNISINGTHNLNKLQGFVVLKR